VNIEQLRDYVELDVDDVFEDNEIARWFNKAIANYNLIEPLTKYPAITILTNVPNTAPPEGTYYITTDYSPVFGDNTNTFMLGIVLPFIVSAIKGQEFATMEKQDYMNEFMRNSRIYKLTHGINPKYVLDNKNLDLTDYEVGANVFASDMDRAPFPGNWRTYSEHGYNPLELDEEE